MNKNKFYTIGLIAGSIFATSCDDRLDCGCDCNMPTFEKWEILKPGVEKNADGTVSSGTAIVVYGKNLSDITAISFGDKSAELQPAFMEDNKIVFQVPEGISEDCIAHVTTASCAQGFDTDLLRVVVAPPCVTMCDNEMAEKTLKVVGNSLFAPLKALFLDKDGKYTLEASTESGTITIEDANHATIKIPAGVQDNGKILFVSKAGESLSNFIFRDTRNMLITHDDDQYLNLFNQDKPDVERYDEESGKTIGLPKPKDVLKSTIFKSENNTTEFSVFHDLAGYTAWTYCPTGEANPEDVEPNYPTPFGCFSESIVKGETKFSDYVIKFEVFVSDQNPIIGNGLAVGFYYNAWQDIRNYCAFWQPSKATFAKDADGVWQAKCDCDAWTSGGDWLTVTIPLDEIKYNFTAKNYFCSAQNDRLITDGSDNMYAGFGDPNNGAAFFDQPNIAKLSGQLLDDGVRKIQSLGFEFGNADQPNQSNEPLIAVDNLRITPSDGNGGVWPLLKWGQSTRDFYTNPVISCR